MTLYLLALCGLLAIILAGYWYEKTPWRYCRNCRRYWHVETKQTQSLCPDECDGIVKARECKECEK